MEFTQLSATPMAAACSGTLRPRLPWASKPRQVEAWRFDVFLRTKRSASHRNRGNRSQRQEQAASSTGGSSNSTGSGGTDRLQQRIRRASTDDLQHLCMLEELTAEGAAWSNKQIEVELSRERATVLVVDEGAGPLGWAVGWAVPGELHIMNVAVHPNHRRRGHARALLTALVDQHRPSAEVALLEVRMSNEPALGLYQSMGFQRVGLRKRYYADGEDAVLMTLQIDAGLGGQGAVS